MSPDLEATADTEPVQGELLDAESSPLTMSLQDFVAELGEEILNAQVLRGRLRVLQFAL